MDEAHLIATAPYVPMNPVRVALAAPPQDWPWSSAKAHLSNGEDETFDIARLWEWIGDFEDFPGWPKVLIAEGGAQAVLAPLRHVTLQLRNHHAAPDAR